MLRRAEFQVVLSLVKAKARGLTLPSSGPAYGGPLKSNVRPRFKPHGPHLSASCVIMKARLPFVALVALSRETRAAAGASSSAHVPKVAAEVGSGCPSFGGQRTVASVRTRESMQPYRGAPNLQSRYQASGRLHWHQPWWPGLFSQYQSAGSDHASFLELASPALVCFAIQMQSKVAAPRAWPNPSFKRTCLRPAA